MRITKIFPVLLLAVISMVTCAGCGKETDDTLVLRVCNWEEYIDEGDWDEEEAIDLDDDNVIIGVNPMYEDFEEWYCDKYGIEVKVEYSCFGTNEDIYNQMTIGDTFDLICPSDYMIMKLMAEGQLEPFSEEFFDESVEENYYVRGVSPYIKKVFEENEINGEPWSDYSAGYMWGTSGIVYNPEYVTREEASSWDILEDPKFHRQVTIKDNVRDSYFAALAINKAKSILEPDFLRLDDYEKRLALEMNDTSDEMISAVEATLKGIKNNTYSFETDSGKADMVAGKVVANYQWSGDAVYTMEQAAEEGVELAYAVPDECGNLWFDGWVMLKSGISENPLKKHAAEAFVNFLSRPDNAVRNMYYIGYTSVISGGDDSTMFDYADWYYGVEEDEEDTVDYDISYFFAGEGDDEEYIITSYAGAEEGGLAAQYPSLDIIRRSVIMNYFDDETYKKINQMWINVRCFNISDIFK